MQVGYYLNCQFFFICESIFLIAWFYIEPNKMKEDHAYSAQISKKFGPTLEIRTLVRKMRIIIQYFYTRGISEKNNPGKSTTHYQKWILWINRFFFSWPTWLRRFVTSLNISIRKDRPRYYIECWKWLGICRNKEILVNQLKHFTGVIDAMPMTQVENPKLVTRCRMRT